MLGPDPYPRGSPSGVEARRRINFLPAVLAIWATCRAALKLVLLRLAVQCALGGVPLGLPWPKFDNDSVDQAE
jgi:hypothetical protein